MSEGDGLMGNRRERGVNLAIFSAGHRQVLRWRITAVDVVDTVTPNALTLYFVISV